MSEIAIAASIFVALLVVAAVFVAGRYTGLRRQGSGSDQDISAALENARLQERERLRTEHASELSAVRQKLATTEEAHSGLERALAREKEVSDQAKSKLEGDLTELNKQKDALVSQLSAESQRLAASDTLATQLKGQISRADAHISDRDTTIGTLTEQLEALRTALASKDSDLAVIAERETGLKRTIVERDQQLLGLQDQLKAEFENIANKVLANSTEQLTLKSQESLAPILDPLRAKITEFQTKVETTHLEDTRQRATLEAQIRQVAATNTSIGQQAENLTKALKGDSQLRGRWGEVRLERILENSGLVRDREFVVQGGDFNMKSEEGGSQRPDVIILLPEDRHLVIDSKVSLVDYLDYVQAETDEARASCIKKLLNSVRGHIDGLAGKNYQHADAINSHDLVLMFVPIEGVAALVLQHDDGIFEYAWARKIVVVSPSTLFMTMQTVASIWRYERQSANAQAIADQAAQLYDKLAAVVVDLNDVTDKIQKAADSHQEAMKKLSTGRGNALGRAQKLRALGVSPKKDMPVILLSGEKHSVEADDDEPIPGSETTRLITSAERTSS